jgi:hypothetical protein
VGSVYATEDGEVFTILVRGAPKSEALVLFAVLKYISGLTTLFYKLYVHKVGA